MQEMQQKRTQRVAEAQHATEAELEVEVESLRQAGIVWRKKLPKISPTNRSLASPSKNNPVSPTDMKTKNTGLYDSVALCDGVR